MARLTPPEAIDPSVQEPDEHIVSDEPERDGEAAPPSDERGGAATRSEARSIAAPRDRDSLGPRTPLVSLGRLTPRRTALRRLGTRRLSRRERIGATVLAVLAIFFITLDLAGGGLRSAHSGARGVLGGLYRGTDSVLGPVRQFLGGVPDAGSNADTISRLRHEIAELQGQQTAAQRDAATSVQLHRLQLAADAGNYRIVPARVIAIGPGEGFDWTVSLDVGTGSGVRVGQTVTDGAGLVGRVLQVDRNTAVVLLGADPGSGVGARDTRSGEIGVASGRGSGGYLFTPLDPAADVRAGDQLITGPSGQSTYVAGLSLGTITTVSRNAAGTVQATVRATTSPTRLDLVGVIIVGGQTAPRTALRPAAPAAGTGPR